MDRVTGIIAIVRKLVAQFFEAMLLGMGSLHLKSYYVIHTATEVLTPGLVHD